MYELYDDCTTMFFYRSFPSSSLIVRITSWSLKGETTGNKHIMVDLGTGNNNKINWAMDNKQEVSNIDTWVMRRRDW